MINCGLLVSGELGLIALIHLNVKVDIQFVFTDKNSIEIIEYCNKKNIDVFVGNPRNDNKKVNEFLLLKSVDYIFSINYLYIVEENILNFPKFYSINFHGSLLPKYRGRTPHVWAIINNEKETGVTAHLMDSECDNGDIVSQIKIEISKNMTGGDILEIYKEKYIELLDKLLDYIYLDKLTFTKQNQEEATYFGKRTPSDGEINWHWQKERIHNWVRAQAYPYPGAFSYLKNKKVIIDEIKFTNYGFSNNIKNGTILAKDGVIPYIKTPNGVIAITKCRNLESINFMINSCFESLDED